VLWKKVRERDAYLKSDGAWRNPKLIGTYVGSRKDGYPGITIGIVGLGRVGSRLADLLRPWGARVIACDPFVDDAKFSAHGVERVDLPTLLKQSDVITLHVFLNRETRHLIGANEFSQMKPTAVFLNASRGAVVDEIALVDALNEGRIRAAALDVFEREPLPLDSPLRGLDERVLLSPHMITNNVGSGLGPAIQLATNALIQALRGEVPDDELIFNPDAIPTWTQRFAGRSVLEALPSNV
jgi:phosphoglycerate dehydrogenase-like enzyme